MTFTCALNDSLRYVCSVGLENAIMTYHNLLVFGINGMHHLKKPEDFPRIKTEQKTHAIRIGGRKPAVAMASSNLVCMAQILKVKVAKLQFFSYKTGLGTNTSHLGKRKIVFKMVWGILVPRRVLALPFWLWYWIWIPIFRCLFFHANNFCRAMFSPPLRRQVGFYVHQLGWKLLWLYPLKFVGHEGW